MYLITFVISFSFAVPFPFDCLVNILQTTGLKLKDFFLCLFFSSTIVFCVYSYDWTKNKDFREFVEHICLRQDMECDRKLCENIGIYFTYYFFLFWFSMFFHLIKKLYGIFFLWRKGIRSHLKLIFSSLQYISFEILFFKSDLGKFHWTWASTFSVWKMSAKNW